MEVEESLQGSLRGTKNGERLREPMNFTFEMQVQAQGLHFPPQTNPCVGWTRAQLACFPSQ